MRLWPWSRFAEMERRHEVLREDWHVVTQSRNAAKQDTLQLTAELARAYAACEERLKEIQWLRSQVEAKDAVILDMRREGFDPTKAVSPTAAAPAQEPKDPLDPKIQMAIEALAEPGSRDAGIMADDARLQLAAGKSLEDVIDSIERGSGINPHRL